MTTQTEMLLANIKPENVAAWIENILMFMDEIRNEHEARELATRMRTELEALASDADEINSWELCQRCGRHLLMRGQSKASVSGYMLSLECTYCGRIIVAPFMFTKPPEEIPF